MCSEGVSKGCKIAKQRQRAAFVLAWANALPYFLDYVVLTLWQKKMFWVSAILSCFSLVTACTNISSFMLLQTVPFK